MASILVQVADAIRHELTLGTFVHEIKPERSYADWEVELSDLGRVHVDVVQAGIRDAELDGRGWDGFMCDVDVGVRKHFDQDELDADGRPRVAAVDLCVELLEQLHQYLTDVDNGRRLTDYAAAAWQSTEFRTTCVVEHLRQMQQYTGIIRATYNVPDEQ